MNVTNAWFFYLDSHKQKEKQEINTEDLQDNRKVFNRIPSGVIWAFPLLSSMYLQIRTGKEFLKKN